MSGLGTGAYGPYMYGNPSIPTGYSWVTCTSDGAARAYKAAQDARAEANRKHEEYIRRIRGISLSK